MMEIELPKIHPSQQDMELIDILWRQDIDLGAGREVFDFSYRQKERELQTRRAREEEERQQLIRDQEKALLAQLQLDEETGEFVPRPPPEVTQNGNFTAEDSDALSFDECMQLLAETFPLEATETTPPCLGASTSPSTGDSHLLMAPAQQALPPLLPAAHKPWPDLDQAWMELLSIPELQCLNMQMQDLLEPTGYLSTNTPPVAQDPTYSLYLPSLTDVVVAGAPEVGPSEFVASFAGAYPGAAPPNLSQMTLKSPDVNANLAAAGFCEMFYPDPLGAKVHGATLPHGAGDVAGPLAEMPSGPLKPMDMFDLSPGDPFASSKPETAAEFPDSDSGLSLDASPSVSSPEKSTHGDGSYGYSDSDLDELDSNPGSVESDYAETYPPPFAADGPRPPPSEGSARRRGAKVKRPKAEPAEGGGHARPPFAKDKLKRRAEARLSRDEQRARALRIPFAVDAIINLPVDDFNELMSKHQFDEAQLALVRDIRRRGKNKVAAQNCRKRKMDSIVGLEDDLDALKEEKERLQREKAENAGRLRQTKQQLSSLYLEVFELLRDEEGKSYSPREYSLQQTSDGNVFLVPRVKKTLVKGDGD